MESDLGKVDYRCDQYRHQIAVRHENIAKLERNLEQQKDHLEVRGVARGVGNGCCEMYQLTAYTTLLIAESYTRCSRCEQGANRDIKVS